MSVHKFSLNRLFAALFSKLLVLCYCFAKAYSLNMKMPLM